PNEAIQMAALGQGAAGFAWTEVVFEEPTALVQRITPEGSFTWEAGGFHVTPRRSGGRNPTVGGDSTGGLWVGWEDFGDARLWRLKVWHLSPQAESISPRG